MTIYIYIYIDIYSIITMNIYIYENVYLTNLFVKQYGFNK